MFNPVRYVLTALLATVLSLGAVSVITESASAKVVQIEPRATARSMKTLSYVEPFRFRRGTPTRLYVEYGDGSVWSYTPCRLEKLRNCFSWSGQTVIHKNRIIRL